MCFILQMFIQALRSLALSWGLHSSPEKSVVGLVECDLILKWL